MSEFNKEDQVFLDKAKSVLDENVDDLDTDTLARLRQARQQALDSTSGKANTKWASSAGGQLVAATSRATWILPAGGLAVAATVAVLTVNVWTTKPIESEITVAFNDIDLLTSSESLEFYEELEFYAWLDEHDANG